MSRIEKTPQDKSNNGCHVVTDKIPLTTGGYSDKDPKQQQNTLNSTHSINDLLDDDNRYLNNDGQTPNVANVTTLQPKASNEYSQKNNRYNDDYVTE